MCIYIYIHIHTYIYTHIYIHTYIYIPTLLHTYILVGLFSNGLPCHVMSYSAREFFVRKHQKRTRRGFFRITLSEPREGLDLSPASRRLLSLKAGLVLALKKQSDPAAYTSERDEVHAQRERFLPRLILLASDDTVIGSPRKLHGGKPGGWRCWLASGELHLGV